MVWGVWTYFGFVLWLLMRIIAGSLGSSISSRLDFGSSFQDNSQVNFCVLLSLFKF